MNISLAVSVFFVPSSHREVRWMAVRIINLRISRLCRCKTRCVKFVDKTLVKGEDMVHGEVQIMQQLSGHLGVVTLKEVYEEA